MIIKIAKNSGFCFGVKRAINLALEASSDYSEIVTLGPLIHNPQMVNKLAEHGIYNVDSIDKIRNCPVIIRSHGIEKNVKDRLEKLAIPIIDATCPFVSSTQDYAQMLSSEGYKIIIFGNRSHPEVIALKSYIDNDPIIVNNLEDLISEMESNTLNINKSNRNKIGIVCQTTQNIVNLKIMTEYLLPAVKELRVFNTICSATSVRQKSSLELAKDSDIIIVVGGRNSSNTKMLYNICSDIVTTYHIETSDELDFSWFENKSKIGITAGASTPDWIIEDVYNRLKYRLSCIKTRDYTSEYKEECNAKQ